MKSSSLLFFLIVLTLFSCSNHQSEEVDKTSTTATDPVDTIEKPFYFIDVHNLEPGKVAFADVEAAHQKDLSVQGKYGVKFINFWVDEKKGKVYCLSQAKNEEAVRSTHKEAHGLMPSVVYKVSSGEQSNTLGNQQLFIDVHQVGPGKVTANDVADAHQKDIAVEKKYGVNFINYWVDEKTGTIMCLSEAADSNAVKNTHKEAHGLLPMYVLKVKQGD